MKTKTLHILVLAAFLTGCASAAVSPSPVVPSPEATFVPYLTSSPQPTLDIHSQTTSTPLPTPTATPGTHTVAKDELGSEIALRFGITLGALQAANPGVDLNFLKEGSTLVIPAPENQPDKAATPTPESTTKGIPVCYPTQDNGAWCFFDIANPQTKPLGSIMAEITIAGQDGSLSASMESALLLDILPPGAQLPIAVHFPAPVPSPLSVSAQILTSLPQPAEESGVIPAEVASQPKVDPSGLSADIQGTATIKLANGQKINELWVVAAGYSSTGQPVGVRKQIISKIENSGAPIPFELTLYSAGPEIDRVVVYAEGH